MPKITNTQKAIAAILGSFARVTWLVAQQLLGDETILCIDTTRLGDRQLLMR